uniref:Uncharacterized protein n=1 Tax=Rhizophora mucronata TaxID=61149 RepID=A0A2P2MCH3_RHIMU
MFQGLFADQFVFFGSLHEIKHVLERASNLCFCIKTKSKG